MISRPRHKPSEGRGETHEAFSDRRCDCSCRLVECGSRHQTSQQAHGAPQSGVTVWNKDSKDPNVGWHTENGMRVCSYDCDNPEIPGSGAVCKNVNFMGMNMRECVTGN